MKNPGKKNLNEYIKWLKNELKEAEAKKDAEHKQIVEKEFKEECDMRRKLDSYTVEDIDKFRCSDKTKQTLLQRQLNRVSYEEKQYEDRWFGEKNQMFLKTIQKIKDLMNSGNIDLYKIPVSKKPFDSKYALISDSEMKDIKERNANKTLVEAFATYF